MYKIIRSKVARSKTHFLVEITQAIDLKPGHLFEEQITYNRDLPHDKGN